MRDNTDFAEPGTSPLDTPVSASFWIAQDAQPAFDDPWPRPQPLTEYTAPLPYPIDCLPVILREAVDEVQRFT